MRQRTLSLNHGNAIPKGIIKTGKCHATNEIDDFLTDKLSVIMNWH